MKHWPEINKQDDQASRLGDEGEVLQAIIAYLKMHWQQDFSESRTIKLQITFVRSCSGRQKRWDYLGGSHPFLLGSGNTKSSTVGSWFPQAPSLPLQKKELALTSGKRWGRVGKIVEDRERGLFVCFPASFSSDKMHS